MLIRGHDLADGYQQHFRNSNRCIYGVYLILCKYVHIPCIRILDQYIHCKRCGCTINISYATIKVYLAAISNLHVSALLHVHFNFQLIPQFQKVLYGVYKIPLTLHSHHSSDDVHD